MNENTRKVLERVAEGVWYSEGGTVDNLFRNTQCVFCYVSPDYEGGHDEDCPVTLARRELDAY